MRQPLLILSLFVWGPLVVFCSPWLALGIPENAGVTYHFRPLLGPREGRGEAATDFVPLCLGIPQNGGVSYHFRLVSGPREGRGEAATFDFFPLCLRIPENAGLT